MSFLALTVDGDFALFQQSSVSFLSHLDVKWHNYINQSLKKYIVVFMFHPDHVEHHHSTILVL